MTTETLWPVLDAAFVALIDSEMGAGSGYADLKLAGVEIFETWDPDTGPYPRVLILSDLATVGPGGHGGGQPHLDQVYTYRLVAIVQAATYSVARSNAQVLLARLRDAVRTNYAAILGTAADNTETPQNINWSRSRIETRGRNKPGATVGLFFGISELTIAIESTI